ncbi:hypothetical protein K1X76_11610 [bacterium]|nr:hypothetical protein [bacterium]
MQNNNSHFRQTILEALQLHSCLEEQIEYQKKVPIADVTAELVCIWFDDLYHPDTDLFRQSFTDDEVGILGEFNDFYAARRNFLPATRDVNELHQSAIWIEIVNKAQRALSQLRSGCK